MGEEVFVQTKQCPEDNGDAVVEDFWFETNHFAFKTKETLPPCWVYVVSGRDGKFCESSLRKKYPPSSLGYEELISALKRESGHVANQHSMTTPVEI